MMDAPAISIVILNALYLFLCPTRAIQKQYDDGHDRINFKISNLDIISYE
jgi:hypothetical protein